MSKGGKTQTTTTALDPRSQAYVNQMRGFAGNAARDTLNQPGSFFTGPLTQTPGELANPWMNLFQDQVIGGIRDQYGYARDLASRGAKQEATLQGAFGGDRAALTEGARLGALDRSEASQIGQLLYSGYGDALSRGTDWARYNQALEQQRLQEPLFRRQAALGMYNLGLGPTGGVTTQQMPGASPFGSAVGGAMTGASIGGPWGAAIGGGIGLLGGLLG